MLYGFSQTLNLTIEAWDSDCGTSSEVIDIFVKSIDFLPNNDWRTLIKNGQNGIGLLNFSYYIQQLEENYTNKCNNEILAGNVTSQQVTSSPADTSYTPTDNNTIQQVHESSSSPWAWIAVAILFMLLTILFFTMSITLAYINKRMAKELKENERKSVCENDGK